MPIPDLDPRRADRISPKSAPWCGASFDEDYNGQCNPNTILDPDAGIPHDCQHSGDPRGATSQADYDLLVALAETANLPANPCLFLGGVNDSDAPGQLKNRHVQALFRNDDIQFMMTNLEQPLSSQLQIRFNVSGGFRAQTVGLPGTVEVGMPARIVVGPFDSQGSASTQAMGSKQAIDIPYLFVVDQRRLGRAQGSSATRGQLLRIHPRGNAITSPKPGQQPLFEDLSHSGNLFPIQ
jgi:hypothetical protein